MHAHTHTRTHTFTQALTQIQTGGKYQLDCPTFLVSLSPTCALIFKKEENMSLLGYDSQVSRMYVLCE